MTRFFDTFGWKISLLLATLILKFGWKTSLLLATLILAAVAIRFLPSSRPAGTGPQKLIYHGADKDRVSNHPIRVGELSSNIGFDAKTGIVQATGPRPWFILLVDPTVAPSATPLGGVTHVRMKIRPETAFNPNDFLLYFTHAYDPQGTFQSPDELILVNLARGVASNDPEDRKALWIDFHLREPGAWCRIHLPEGAAFRLDILELATEADPSVSAGIFDWRGGLKVFAAGIVIGIVLMLVQMSRRPIVADARRVKDILLVGLVLSSSTLLLILPPFQGPDEIPHWKTALLKSRIGLADEPVLYHLNEILGTSRLRWKAQEQIDSQFLRAYTRDQKFAPVPDDRVGYAHWLTYPTVSAVALIFPKVETLDEAYLFYYCCRFLPAVLLFVMLLVANRRDLLPYTGLFLFSTPYVLQQCTIIAPDTLANLGTLLAVLLFVSLRRERSVPRLVWLWIVCLLVVAAKPPVYAALLLLPLVETPLSRIPHKRIVIPLAVTSAIVIAIVGAWIGMGIAGGGNVEHGKDISAQVRSLTTAEGWRTFWNAMVRTFDGRVDLSGFCQPLGWLDTFLNNHHLTLLYIGAILALLLDLIESAPSVPAIVERKKRLAALLAGLIAANFVFVAVAVSLVSYITWTLPNHEAAGLVGVQIRYLFPPAILLIFLPLALNQESQGPPDKPSCFGRLLLNSLALGTFGLLLFARHIHLTFDLLARYW